MAGINPQMSNKLEALAEILGDQDLFFEEDPVFDRTLSDTLVVDRIPIPSDDAPTLISRQQAANSNPYPAAAAGQPLPSRQPQNVTQVTNDTTNATSQIPGYIGNGPITGSGLANCSNPGQRGLSSRCWEELNLTGYVTEWLSRNTCNQGEGFASCFLRQNNYPGKDCSVMSFNRCTDPEWFPGYSEPKSWYVAYNIFAINNFFANWGAAVTAGASGASWNIAQIVQLINPPKENRMTIQIIMVVFQSVFALVPGPLGIWAASQGKGLAVQAWAQVFSNALATAPNVGRFIFPTDSTQSQLIQMGELGAQFAKIVNQVQANLNLTSASVMANSTEFLAFATQGNFSNAVGTLPSLVDQSNYLYYALNTYLISSALNGNQVYGVIGRGTNPQQLNKNGTKTNYPIDCEKYNELDICDTWWYSRNYNSAFALNDFKKANRNFNKELNALFGNMTTGQLLFEAAYTCNAQKNFGQPVNVFVDAGGLNTACISQLKILTWDMTCHAEGVNSPDDCEFLEQGKQPAFWQGKNHRSPETGVRGVPWSYLGPGITRPRDKIILNRS